ncbi:MAG: hypothetical protein K8F36_08480 [Melioribacteraceae bacterium]|nr:hypothetical protein [Melioribacteraceae bacterium]MCO6472305.1 hypothetical protein [Melioribacteraceae bacterium]MDD3558475.1 hypothetical protein [Melioribacteraceae bacterium]
MISFFDSWLPFIYLYGVGGVLFTTGMVLISKSKSLDLRKKIHKFWFKVLIFGFIYFMLIHGLFTIAALYW